MRRTRGRAQRGRGTGGEGRRGFTLVEVLAALSIGALLLLGARAVLERLADGADRITASAMAADRMANTERVVRALALRAAAASDTNPAIGNVAAARWISWCDVPGGWTERCTVTMGVVPASAPHKPLMTLLMGNNPRERTGEAGPASVVVYTSSGDTLVLREGVRWAVLRYLADAANGGHWAPGWGGEAQTPLAFGVVTDRDTIVLRVGERR